ncbi:AraC family transcriptional regulator [Actomonas aquatica]|uniref:AraC family transcriptional regulator n=1 Tax=Actomonas aquatica TaxID=2866162 RepID=A0ABZ1C7Q1_9BACT|nr:AraC family transcriptional regulator [Opitutus sp. WL0086]WRQ87437.1 AraC family transcriptional regulator [Opitutus sp. WL0086]
MAATTYPERINRALDYIQQHLDQPLSLEDVARVACFSPFHFHRIFRFQTGEPLNACIKRLRLERAVTLMTQRRPAGPRNAASLTEIALACGFGSSTDFSRSFKQHYGVPPSQFDVAGFRRHQRERWQDYVADSDHRHLLDGLPPGENPDHFAVTFRDLPPRTVAYRRIHNSYREGAVTTAAAELLAWAESRGLADGQWLGYTWDDPEVVPPEKCRYDVGLEVPPITALPDGEVSRLTFPAMTVAELELRGGIDLEMRALDWLYGTWLPSSGCVPTDEPCFEAWIGRPFAHGMEHFELRLQLPVTRA